VNLPRAMMVVRGKKFGRSCHDFTSTCSIADAASITHATLLFVRYHTPWSLTSTTKCDILSIITGWLSWYLAHVDWIGIQFNNEGLDMFVCTLSQSSLMSDWFTNRSQIWMIIIRYRRTCPALLIANLIWMTNWSSTRMRAGTGSIVELDDRQLYRCIRLHVFNSSKTVSFILPDDKFKLMRYVFLIGPAINDNNRRVPIDEHRHATSMFPSSMK